MIACPPSWGFCFWRLGKRCRARRGRTHNTGRPVSTRQRCHGCFSAPIALAATADRTYRDALELQGVALLQRVSHAYICSHCCAVDDCAQRMEAERIYEAAVWAGRGWNTAYRGGAKSQQSRSSVRAEICCSAMTITLSARRALRKEKMGCPGGLGPTAISRSRALQRNATKTAGQSGDDGQSPRLRPSVCTAGVVTTGGNDEKALYEWNDVVWQVA